MDSGPSNSPSVGDQIKPAELTGDFGLARQRHKRILLYSTLSPFLGLVLALWHPRQPVAKNLVWMFTAFYGAVFYIAANSTADSAYYAEQLWLMHNTEFGFGDLAGRFFADHRSYQDLYQPILTFLASRITDQTWLLFGAFGFVLGYFYSRNVWFLIDRIPRQPGLTIGFLILAFALVMGIGLSLNGVRMWTALHVFIFGVLYFAETTRPKYLLIALLSPLIHFSFYIPCALLLAFLFVKRFGTPVYAFFVASFFVSALDLELIRGAAEYLPFTTGDRAIQSYIERADPDGLLTSPERPQAWFLTVNSVAASVFMFLAATWLYLRGVHKRQGVIGFIFVFGMLIYGLVNLVAYVPSAGRFFRIGDMLILAAAILFLADRTRAKKLDYQLAAAALPLLGIHFALGVRLLLEYASVWVVFGNFFVAPFVDPAPGLYEIIKGLL